jgi:simple sugar transport system permease protein
VTGRLGNILFPILAVLLAFLIGGLVVLFAGANPITVYKSMWLGAGFDWPFQYLPGNPFGVNGTLSEFNLIATLVAFTPLVLTGLAVAFAFRCGLFNIGGQGQYWVGATAGFLVALHVGGLAGSVLGTVVGLLAGAGYAGIAGALKAFRGTHEVITTIMLNWIAIYACQWAFGLGGPLVNKDSGQPISDPLPPSAYYHTIWGVVQGVTIGIFVSLGACVLYWLVLNRTTLGYEVRAVGHNPEAARYGGISVRRSITLAMAISGAFAGLAGVGQVLGVSHQVAATDIRPSTVGFTGIAVALLGRNTAIGVPCAALLFAALESGARFLAGDFSPTLATSLGVIIQGIIILLVGGETILRWILATRRRAVPPVAADPDITLPEAAHQL